MITFLITFTVLSYIAANVVAFLCVRESEDAVRIFVCAGAFVVTSTFATDTINVLLKMLGFTNA